MPDGYDPDCGTITQRHQDLGNFDVICAASYGGHPCCLDRRDLDHFPPEWPDDQPWLLGVTHQCACNPPHTWPEVR